MPSTIQDAICSLVDLGVDVSALNAHLETTREDFANAGLLQKTEFQGETHFTMDHALAIHAYTLEDPQEISVFQKVNSQFNDPVKRRDTKSPGMTAAMRFIKYLDHALEFLPDSSSLHGPKLLYRGVKGFVHDDFETKFATNKEIAFYSMKSFSADPDLMNDSCFCGKKGKRTIYVLHQAQGKMKCIKEFSQMDTEEEYLGRPLQKLKVMQETKKQCTGDDSKGDPFQTADIIHLEVLTNELPRSSRDRGALEAQIKIDPRDPEAWLALAHLEAEDGRLVDERCCLTKALECKSDLIETWRRLAANLDKSGTQKQPVNGRTFSAQQCEVRAQALELRFPDLVQALELDPECDAAWNSFGFQGGGRLGDQEYSQKDCFLRALQLNPSSDSAWNNLGMAGGGRIGDQDHSKKDCCLKALQLKPSNAVLWSNLGFAGGGCLGDQDYSEKDCYLKALQLDSSLDSAWHNLGMAGGGRIGDQDYSKKDCLLKALQLNPNNDRTWCELQAHNILNCCVS
eukprot:Skav224129  [mRNA]  locus=scaffold2427:425453:426991:- [translate_table: standard]